jgi:hypothetical protein
MKRRKFLFTAAFGIGSTSGFGLIGCGGSEALGSNPPVAAPPPPQGSPSPSPAPVPAPPPPAGSPPALPSGTGTIDIEFKNASLYGVASGDAYIFKNIKHHRIIEYNGYLYLSSGDWAGFPSRQLPDYPPSSNWGEAGRQEMWRASLTPNASGRIEWELANNFYHNYPWNGSSGHFAPEPQKGPYMPDAQGFTVDKRGDFWVGPFHTYDSYSGLDGPAAGYSTTHSVMFKWNLPGVHSNGIRYGNGWTVPSQDRLWKPATSAGDYDIAPSFDGTYSHNWGRQGETAYDPVKDQVVTCAFSATSSALRIQLFKFDCVPTAGKHLWHKTSTLIAPSALGGLSSTAFTGLNASYSISNAAIVGRKFFSVCCFHYSGVAAGTGNWGTDNTTLRSAILIQVDLDTGAVSHVPWPAAQKWFLRAFDGPNGKDSYGYGMVGNTAINNGFGLTSSDAGQYRKIVGVNDKLVLGPGKYTQIKGGSFPGDAWIMVYDPATGTWQLWEPPTTHDWPFTLGNLVAVPSLGEAWLVGGIWGGDISTAHPTYQQWLANNNIHISQQSAGRRIFRFKIA